LIRRAGFEPGGRGFESSGRAGYRIRPAI